MDQMLRFRIEAARKDLITSAACKTGETVSAWARRVLEDAAVDELLSKPQDGPKEDENAD
jgi:uncharacterized protein (DUF1778 family)